MRANQRYRYRYRAWVLSALLGALAHGALAAETLRANHFSWRATVALPAGVGLARVDVPAQALVHMQSASAQDLRIFNADGLVVPYTVLRGQDLQSAGPAQQTPSYKAYPLFAGGVAYKPARGSVQVHMNADASGASAWVYWNDTHSETNSTAREAGGAVPLEAVLFDTRGQKQAVSALDVGGNLPHNVLIPMVVSVSSDLKTWSSVATKGPLFQFDGADAPVNRMLELEQPLSLEGRYLRLSWSGQAETRVASVSARVASHASAPQAVRAALGAGVGDGTSALSWTLPFATPIAALHLQTLQDNTLVPVRIQGRGEPGQPWRNLASTVVYRLSSTGQGDGNPATPLNGASVRALRVQASQGVALPAGGLQATVEFAPLQVAFVASGAQPFTLAVGRARTNAATVDAAQLGSVVPASTPWAQLPVATLTDVQLAPDAPGLGAGAPWLPAGTTPRSAMLWAVLGGGVLLLAGVAYSLFRQIAARGAPGATKAETT